MTPKIFILPFDANQNSDATVTKQLLDFLPNKVSSESQADVVLTVCSYMAGYKFNPALLEVKKKLVILDFLEMGWNAGEKENVLGRGALKQFGHLDTEDYAKLDQWVKDFPPRLTFKRELKKVDVREDIVPCEWLCYIEPRPRHTKEEFNTRAFDLFNCFGLSNPLRFQLHGEVFQGAHMYGYNVIDNWSIQKVEKRNFVSIYSPWFSRQSIDEVMRWQRRAKISVSLPGAGVKCFRNGESICDCIMALPYDLLAWTYPLNHGENCIRIRPDHMIEDLETATRLDNLYEIYLAGLATAELYRSKKYVADYVMNRIISVLT